MKPLTKVRRAADKAALALRERDDAIRHASAEGIPMRTIAEAAGLSHQRIHQITQRPTST